MTWTPCHSLHLTSRKRCRAEPVRPRSGHDRSGDLDYAHEGLNTKALFACNGQALHHASRLSAPALSIRQIVHLPYSLLLQVQAVPIGAGSLQPDGNRGYNPVPLESRLYAGPELSDSPVSSDCDQIKTDCTASGTYQTPNSCSVPDSGN